MNIFESVNIIYLSIQWYFGVKNGTNYFVNTIIHKYLVGPYSSGIPKLLSNFEIPCSLNGRGSNREPRTYWYELWILELKVFFPYATQTSQNYVKNRNNYTCVLYFVDFDWLIFLFFPSQECTLRLLQLKSQNIPTHIRSLET